jgi:integrase
VLFLASIVQCRTVSCPSSFIRYGQQDSSRIDRLCALRKIRDESPELPCHLRFVWSHNDSFCELGLVIRKPWTNCFRVENFVVGMVIERPTVLVLELVEAGQVKVPVTVPHPAVFVVVPNFGVDVKPATLVNWQGYLDNHILAVLGSQSIAEVNNASMKKLVEVLVGKGLTPKSISNICLVVKLVKASAVDENGDELYSMKWNPEFIDAPVVDTRKQHTPSLTGAEITKIVASAEGWFQTFCILDAATGLRAGELLGLEIRHFDGRSIKVEQSVWRSDAQAPKTQNAYRTVDLHPDVAELLSGFVGDRKSGYIFCTSKGKPHGQSNILRRKLHPALEKLGIKRCGFHAFRRFRNTFLRNYTSCPNGLRNFWLGWSGKDMSDHYDKIREDEAFRREVAERAGIGFELPKPPIVPSVGNVPSSGEEVELATA